MAETIPDDLSAGNLREDEATSTNYRLALDKQKLRHRAGIFWASMTCGVALIVSFLYFACNVIRAMKAAPPLTDLPWPFVAFGSVTLIAGSTLLFGIARFAYRQDNDTESKGAETESFPPAVVLKQLTELVQAVTGKSAD